MDTVSSPTACYSKSHVFIRSLDLYPRGLDAVMGKRRVVGSYRFVSKTGISMAHVIRGMYSFLFIWKKKQKKTGAQVGTRGALVWTRMDGHLRAGSGHTGSCCDVRPDSGRQALRRTDSSTQRAAPGAHVRQAVSHTLRGPRTFQSLSRRCQPPAGKHPRPPL